jgi:hypothetical protein
MPVGFDLQQAISTTLLNEMLAEMFVSLSSNGNSYGGNLGPVSWAVQGRRAQLNSPILAATVAFRNPQVRFLDSGDSAVTPAGAGYNGPMLRISIPVHFCDFQTLLLINGAPQVYQFSHLEMTAICELPLAQVWIQPSASIGPPDSDCCFHTVGAAFPATPIGWNDATEVALHGYGLALEAVRLDDSVAGPGGQPFGQRGLDTLVDDDMRVLLLGSLRGVGTVLFSGVMQGVAAQLSSVLTGTAQMPEDFLPLSAPILQHMMHVNTQGTPWPQGMTFAEGQDDPFLSRVMQQLFVDATVNGVMGPEGGGFNAQTDFMPTWMVDQLLPVQAAFEVLEAEEFGRPDVLTVQYRTAYTYLRERIDGAWAADVASAGWVEPNLPAAATGDEAVAQQLTTAWSHLTLAVSRQTSLAMLQILATDFVNRFLLAAAGVGRRVSLADYSLSCGGGCPPGVDPAPMTQAESNNGIDLLQVSNPFTLNETDLVCFELQGVTVQVQDNGTSLTLRFQLEEEFLGVEASPSISVSAAFGVHNGVPAVHLQGSVAGLPLGSGGYVFILAWMSANAPAVHQLLTTGFDYGLDDIAALGLDLSWATTIAHFGAPSASTRRWYFPLTFTPGGPYEEIQEYGPKGTPDAPRHFDVNGFSQGVPVARIACWRDGQEVVMAESPGLMLHPILDRPRETVGHGALEICDPWIGDGVKQLAWSGALSFVAKWADPWVPTFRRSALVLLMDNVTGLTVRSRVNPGLGAINDPKSFILLLPEFEWESSGELVDGVEFGWTTVTITAECEGVHGPALQWELNGVPLSFQGSSMLTIQVNGKTLTVTREALEGSDQEPYREALSFRNTDGDAQTWGTLEPAGLWLICKCVPPFADFRDSEAVEFSVDGFRKVTEESGALPDDAPGLWDSLVSQLQDVNKFPEGVTKYIYRGCWPPGETPWKRRRPANSPAHGPGGGAVVPRPTTLQRVSPRSPAESALWFRNWRPRFRKVPR